MHTRLLLKAVPTLMLAFCAMSAAPAASAQERPILDGMPFTVSPRQPLFDVAPFPATASVATLRNASQAAAQAPPTTTTPNEHQFGAGVRLGGVNIGIGASVRYFFYGGPLGVQGEVSRHGYDLDSGPFDISWSSVQFSPAVIYRFREYRWEAPLTLTPYGGAGLTFIHFDFDDDDDDVVVFPDADDTSVGLLLFGGVELFFDSVPNLGVSGELTINTNDDLDVTSVGGAAFTVAGHWYFW